VEQPPAPGDNLYTASTLAINPDNGQIVWHYQTTPHDGWDFDGVNEFIPFDATINGKPMKLAPRPIATAISSCSTAPTASSSAPTSS
jgi:glucose dehydrogenase